MSLLSASERLAAIDRSEVVFDSGRCLHTNDRFSECELCFSICPAQAIVSGKPPQLDAKMCTQCMACLPVCPTGAYNADDDVASLLSAVGHLEGGVVELLCERNPHAASGAEGSTGIRIKHCLASLGAGAYVALGAFAVEEVQVRCDACSECIWASLAPAIEKQTAMANDFLSSWKAAPFINVVTQLDTVVERPLWNADNPPVSRRELFRMMANRSQTFMARAMENGVSQADRRPGRDRLRLNGAVEHLGQWATGANVGLSKLNFTTIQVNENCSACGTCAKACPTEALVFSVDAEQTQFSLAFYASRCVDCGLCAHVCLSDAITYQAPSSLDEVFMEEPVVLASGGLMKCSRCGTITVQREDTDLCPVCVYRIEHPMGSKLPPTLQAALAKRTKGIRS